MLREAEDTRLNISLLVLRTSIIPWPSCVNFESSDIYWATPIFRDYESNAIEQHTFLQFFIFIENSGFTENFWKNLSR
jgi:hypothetical protein